ncbi:MULTISPECIES: glycosyltransferase family 2 protein [unclassified Rhizobium]|uniref:glycosyltransferase family 2 protein n=2 Tax=unclassified Rhizobium TaxID=2613769 RepID=UPI00161505D0|nr:MULTISPECIES: glycosyltransferase family 2 protein [unclassified Rhizobium]
MPINARVVVMFPVFNGAATLQESLQSIADQDFVDFRAIVLNNCSTDETLQIAQRFCEKDARFSVVSNDAHLSAEANFAKAVQLGAEAAEYFCLRAADDLSSRDFLGRLVEALDADGTKLLAACPTKSFNDKGFKLKSPAANIFDFQKSYARGRVPRNLTFPSEWIYGLFRSRSVDILMARWYELGNPWGFASYVLSEFVVRDLVAYVSGPTLDFREGSGSQQKYGAKGFRDKLSQRLTYTLGCYRLVDKLPPVALLTRAKFFRMCWNDARRKTRYKLLWIF